MPDFNSPDPRVHNPDDPIVETQCIIQCSAQRELDYEENPIAEPGVSTFADLEKYGRKPTKKLPAKPLFQQILEEKPSEKEFTRSESEQMVEWGDVQALTSMPTKTSPGENSVNRPVGNQHIFAFTGVLDKVRRSQKITYYFS